MADPHLRREPSIGLSALGRPIAVRFFGDPAAPLRLLFLSGQHGDERAVRRSLREFLSTAPALLEALGGGIQIAAIELLNPDGEAVHTRPNANGLDLNRDHLFLRAPETQALHRFVGHWQPHLIADLHNFPSRRRHLLERQVRLGWDLCLDLPTNPAAPFAESHAIFTPLERRFQTHLARAGFCFGRYTIIQPNGTVRHGTPQLVDARNVLAVRYGIPVLLIEARNPHRLHGPHDARRLREATRLACEQILHWAHDLAPVLSAAPQPPGSVPLRFRRRRAGIDALIPVVDLESGAWTTLSFPAYRPAVEGRRLLPLPAAYALPKDCYSVIEILNRHGLKSAPAPTDCRLLVKDVSAARQIPAVPRRLNHYLLYPTDQAGGRLLPLLLETSSRYTIHGRPHLPPIHRVLSLDPATT